MSYQRKLLSMDVDGNGNILNIMKHIDIVRNTIYLLEKNFDISQYLEAEQWSRFRGMKMNNEKLSNNLKEVEQRNTKMLNLFRANVTDELPDSLKNQVKRSWQQKYDALLNLNSQLRRELHLKNKMIDEKNCEIAILQQKLLNIGEKLTERDEAVKDIFQKYLTLKKNRGEQEIILQKPIEFLQDLSKMIKSNNKNLSSEISCMSLNPTKEALSAHETQKSEPLTQDNNLLRSSLQQSRINCNCSDRDSVEISSVSTSL